MPSASFSASTSAYITSGFDKLMARPMRPLFAVGKPLPSTSVQLSPPLLLFHRPLPGPPEFRKYGPRTRSQLDAQITFGSRGSSTMSTKPALSLMNFTSFHESPPSVVR